MVPGITGCQGGGDQNSGTGGGQQSGGGGNAVKAIKRFIDERPGKTGLLPVIWIQGQSCTGCSVSLLNANNPDIAELLTETISLEYHQTVMASAGDVALKMLERASAAKTGEFILVLEGAIPVGDKAMCCTIGERAGKPVTAETWMGELAKKAKAIVAVGACAAFGGIPAAKGNPTGAKAVRDLFPESTFINLPGCPTHPDWIIGTIAHVLLFGIPELDELHRPKIFFGKVVHDQCERRADFEEGRFAKDFGEPGCLFDLGCKGQEAHCDSCLRTWNNHTNWCIRSGGPCIGCTEPVFPDWGKDGLYTVLATDGSRRRTPADRKRDRVLPA